MSAAYAISEETQLAALLARFPDLRCDIGKVGDRWLSFEELAAIRDVDLEKMLALQALGSPGLDRRGQGAFVIGECAYALASLCAVLHFHHCAFPLIEDGMVATRSVAGQSSAEPDGIHLRLATVPSATLGEARAGRFATHFVKLLKPIVERLFEATRIGRRAQWRLVADMLAAAFLHYGKMAGRVDQAEADALDILAEGNSPMSNRQVGFQGVSVVTQAGKCVSDRFIKRGGCCRYYTATEGGYCSTCVMRKPDDQQAELQMYLLEIS